MTSSFKTVVFDLDGTLVDTGPDLTAALNHALGQRGHPAVGEDEVRHMVGRGAVKLLERGLATRGVDNPQAEVAELLPVFLDYYAQNICERSRPYPGVEAALDAFAAAGVHLAVCTNKSERLSRLLIDALGWTGRFAANLGGDSLPVKKPNPEHLLATIRAAGGTPESAAFVGDTAIDVGAARAAGVPIVAVGFGFCDGQVEELGADAVIHHYDALAPTLERLALRRAA